MLLFANSPREVYKHCILYPLGDLTVVTAGIHRSTLYYTVPENGSTWRAYVTAAPHFISLLILQKADGTGCLCNGELHDGIMARILP